MDKSEVINLISYGYIQNAKGVRVREEQTSRQVFVNVTSVTGSEWFEGGRNGLNPQLRFTMFSYDYEGEDVCEYQGELYSIYRTYRTRNDDIELYVEKRKGNQ